MTATVERRTDFQSVLAAGGLSANLNTDPSRVALDATTIVRGWIGSPNTEHGLLLKGVNETVVQQHAFFDGIDPADPTRTPSLVVTFLPRAS